ncbi:MAG: hypothetical protein QUS14_08060 [Pyrinomonadaceae bacterium]|nr:hypothetical protein [Pyrinomonadaceae bacterium]
MKERYIQILGVVLTAAFGVFIAFLYAAEPRSIGDISLKARSTIENVATKGQVVIGTYEVDPAKFGQGVQAFRTDNFIAARDLLEKADPEKRDARTQFYIAYSYYRQGWGRVSNDDALFKRSLETLDRVAMLDPNSRSDDPDLKLRTAAELRNELEEGLRVTADDFNPFRVFNERK